MSTQTVHHSPARHWPKYFPRVFYSPREVFERLLNDRSRQQIALAAMVAMALLYSFVPVFLAILDGIPYPEPFLRIPDDRYFYWASYFYVPVLLLGWVFGSAVLQLTARWLGGSGSFEATFALTGFATAAASLAALLPDLAITLVQVVGLMEYREWFASVHGGGAWMYIVWAYLILYLALFLVFFAVTAEVVHRLPWRRAAIAGTVGFAAYQGFILIFIR
jgi:hypothetical protein